MEKNYGNKYISLYILSDFGFLAANYTGINIFLKLLGKYKFIHEYEGKWSIAFL